MRVALHVRRGDVMPVDKGDRGAREGAAWGLPLKAQCKAVELAAYWPCLRAYLESRANETARVVVVSTAGRADLPGADDAPVPDVAYLADRPPPPCFPASCWFFVSSSFCRGAEPTEPMFETGPRRRHRREITKTLHQNHAVVIPQVLAHHQPDVRRLPLVGII